jgi:hypothetical protein
VRTGTSSARTPYRLGDDDVVRGEPGAGLRAVLYADLDEPASRDLYRVLRAAAAVSPLVCFGVRLLPVPAAPTAIRGSLPAVHVARCQGMFWAMCDRIVDGRSDAEPLVDHLLSLRLDLDRARSDLMAGSWWSSAAADGELARSGGVDATPTVFLNGLAYEPDGPERLAVHIERIVAHELPGGQRPW